jgi:4-amino-4-deoxy-L-arabinose transferase-like glycosyltransferase
MQFVIGSLNCVLVYYIGKRVFSEAAGILSGVMLALYRPSIFYEGLRSASFLSLFLNCIIILLILRIIEKPFLRGWLLTGVLIGLSGLSSAAIFMFLPFLLFWILRYYQDGKKMICCVLVLAGVLLIIGATAVRNYLVAKDFVPVTCHSGITFYASNNPDSFGLFHLPQDLGGNINLIRTNSKVYAEQVLKKQLKPSQ